MAAGALKRALDPSSERDHGLVSRVRLRGRSGRWLKLRVSLTEPTPGRPSETVVVISPSEPEEVARLNASSSGLTGREEQIVKLVVCGLSTRDVSGALFSSEHTVNNHLRNIFEKAGGKQPALDCPAPLLRERAARRARRLTAVRKTSGLRWHRTSG